MKIKKNRGQVKDDSLKTFAGAFPASTQLKTYQQQFATLYGTSTSSGTITNSGNSYTYLPAKPKFLANMTPETEKMVYLILAGLARAAGGTLVLTDDDLGELTDQIIIDVQEKAGLVSITLLPDYVKVGYEPPEEKLDTGNEFYVKWDTTGLSTMTVPNGASGTYQLTGTVTTSKPSRMLFDEIK